MIKLKDLLNESSPGFENRKFGDPLPTIFDIANKHKSNKEVDEGIADDDMKSAEKLRHGLEDTITLIDKQMIMIDQKLSSFNSPGLKHAFIDALKDGLKRQGKFDWKSASRRLKQYYK